MQGIRAYIAEIIGTFALVFAGTGAVIVDKFSGGSVTHVGISIVFGLVVMAMIYSMGDVSGAHLNPAVTLGFYSAGRMTLQTAFYYIVSQISGAILASGTLSFIFPFTKTFGETVPSINISGAFAMEFIISFFLMFVIINVATGSKEQGLMAGIAIGGYVALAALFAGPVTGASMNPARTIGPAVFSGNYKGFWVYMIAPIVAAAAAAWVHKHISCRCHMSVKD